MEMKIYECPQTDIVSLSVTLLQEIGYEGGTVSGGGDINPVNLGFFEEEEEELPALNKHSSNLWDE